MKKLFTTTLLLTLSFGVGALANVCSSLPGKYRDSKGWTNILKVSADCSQMKWTVNVPQSQATSRVLLVDGAEHGTEVISSRNTVFVKGSYNDKYLTFDERVQTNEGVVISRTRTTYYLRYDKFSELVEEHAIVNDDGSVVVRDVQTYIRLH
jgi:hypothetical protein